MASLGQGLIEWSQAIKVRIIEGNLENNIFEVTSLNGKIHNHMQNMIWNTYYMRQ